MITIVELAKLAGVSDAIVSLVLSGKARGRVGETKRKKILELARVHRYRRNIAEKLWPKAAPIGLPSARSAS